MINGVSIYEDVNAAIAAYQKQDYEGFGRKVGDAVHKAIIGVDHPTHHQTHAVHTITTLAEKHSLSHENQNLKNHHSIDLAKGFVEGFGASTPKDECINTSEGIAVNFDKIIADFQKETPSAIMEAITLLTETFEQELPKAMSDCEDTKKEIDQILKELEKFKTSKQLLVHIGEDIV